FPHPPAEHRPGGPRSRRILPDVPEQVFRVSQSVPSCSIPPERPAAGTGRGRPRGVALPLLHVSVEGSRPGTAVASPGAPRTKKFRTREVVAWFKSGLHSRALLRVAEPAATICLLKSCACSSPVGRCRYV